MARRPASTMTYSVTRSASTIINAGKSACPLASTVTVEHSGSSSSGNGSNGGGPSTNTGKPGGTLTNAVASPSTCSPTGMMTCPKASTATVTVRASISQSHGGGNARSSTTPANASPAKSSSPSVAPDLNCSSQKSASTGTATVMATATARGSTITSTATPTISVMPSPASSHANNRPYTTLTLIIPGIFTDTLTYNTHYSLTCSEFAYGKGVSHITAQSATATKTVRKRGMGAIE